MTCIPAGNKSINAKVGLLTCLVVAPSRSCGSVAKSASNIHLFLRKRYERNRLQRWDLQQLVLYRILTGFPFHRLRCFDRSRLLCNAKIEIISISCTDFDDFFSNGGRSREQSEEMAVAIGDCWLWRIMAENLFSKKFIS